MLVLKQRVEEHGYKVVHIKTDSIKIANADPFVERLVKDFGREYGYTFETEGYFDKFVLLNDAAYVAHEKNGDFWITKAKQFQEPYVRKTLFTKEKVTIDDLAQTYSVNSDSSLYLDMNEKLQDATELEKEVEKYEKSLAKGKLPKGWEDEAGLREWIQEMKEVEIPSRHDMKFVGRVGSFLPVKDGYNGGILYRVKDGKPFAASGSSGYRWLETEFVRDTYGEEAIDMTFYDDLATKAKEDISQYGDFDLFVNSKPKINEQKDAPLIDVGVAPAEDFMNIPEGVEEEWLPFR